MAVCFRMTFPRFSRSDLCKASLRSQSLVLQSKQPVTGLWTLQAHNTNNASKRPARCPGKKETSSLRWIRFTVAPPRHDSGANFQRNDFGFRPESQSYRPKVGVMDQKSDLQPVRLPESEPNRPEKAPE